MKKEENKKILIPFLVMVLSAVLLTTTLLMPYASATEEHGEILQKYPDSWVDESTGMSAEETRHMSMVEFAGVYNAIQKEFPAQNTLILYVVLVAIIGALALLTVLFACLKKPVVAIICNILTTVVFCVQSWDYKDRGVVPSNRYDWGIGYYVFYIAAVLVLVGAVWLIKSRKRENTVIPAA